MIIIIIIIIITTFFPKVTFKFYMYTYTNKLYLKRAFVNKQDIINHTQTKRIIHV